jgi:hypothetical protein
MLLDSDCMAFLFKYGEQCGRIKMALRRISDGTQYPPFN